jgi:tetratricopeptide (TPR) repeat protein
VIGWGGSLGHLEDLRSIAPPLIAWLQQHRHVRLEVMGDPRMAELFRQLPADRFRFQLAGSLRNYLGWLESIDIGLAPLLHTEFNRCRSDVKFLEYASRGVVPVLQRLDPYLPLAEGETALLFSDHHEMLACLDHLHENPALRQSIAQAAYDHVRAERLLEQHVPRRLAFYRRLVERINPSGPAPEQPLLQAAATPLISLPGWQRIGPDHLRLNLNTLAEQQRAVGIAALQKGAMEEAAEAFSAAVRLDPGDAHALTFLGHCLQRQGRMREAQASFERAISLDPLLSRPVRALARLHRRAADAYARRAAELNPLDPPRGSGP